MALGTWKVDSKENRKLQDKFKAISSKSSTPGEIKTVDIFSSKDKSRSVSVINGTVRLLYWESLLQDTVRASVVFTDSGSAMKPLSAGAKKGRRYTSGTKKVGAVEGLPVVGSEKVHLKFADNNGNTIDFKGDESLYVNKLTPLPTPAKTTNKSYELDLVSKEYIDNEKVRVRVCRGGQVSDHVEFILEDVLKTKKDIDLEETKKPLDFIGNNKKPFYTINELSKKAVSSKIKGEGNTAGYLFWETATGYHFKSIDTILTGKKKISILYNETPDGDKGIPPGYDVKALSLETDNRVNVEKKLKMGAYSTRSMLFDPFTGDWKCTTSDILGEEGRKKIEEEYLKLGAEALPELNKEFAKEGGDAEFSRTTFHIVSTGQLMTGDTKEQLEKSKKENFEYGKVFNQAVMRYNQLFASQITVVIPGDFSLHAGDTVFCDIPEMSESQNKACGDEVNKEDGGLYIIADLCHYITAEDTLTKLNLIRDSFGREGSPTNGKTS